MFCVGTIVNLFSDHGEITWQGSSSVIQGT